MDIKVHVSRNPSDSGYVSTSKTMAAAKRFAQDHGLDEDAYYYTMRADGIDVNETLGSDSPFPWEEEIAVPLGIPMSDIISAEGPQGEAEDLAAKGACSVVTAVAAEESDVLSHCRACRHHAGVRRPGHMWHEVDLTAFRHGKPVDAKVRFVAEIDCFVDVRIAPETTIVKKGSDYWEALMQVRTELEREDVQLACNGARIDVFPSQMQRQAIHGRKAYVLVKPRTAERCEVVDIFDPAPLELVGTVAEQRTFYDAWLHGDG